jgi:hypothetical protein
MSSWKINIVLDRRKIVNECLEFLHLTQIEQDTNPTPTTQVKPGITLDVKELAALILGGILATVFAIQGNNVEALAVAGPIIGYAVGKSNPR